MAYPQGIPQLPQMAAPTFPVPAKVSHEEEPEPTFFGLTLDQFTEKTRGDTTVLVPKSTPGPEGTPSLSDLKDDLEVSRHGQLLRNVLESIPTSYSTILGWDNWLENKLNEQIAAKSTFIGLRKEYYIKYGPAFIIPPYITKYNTTRIFTPAMARTGKLTYFNEVRIHITLYKGSTPENPCSGEVVGQTEKPEPIGKIPCMLHSKGCHLRGKSEEELIAMHEDPRDKGGYFIFDGLERTIFFTEMLQVNKFIIGVDNKQKPPQEFIAITADNTVKGTMLTTLRVIHPTSPAMPNSLIHLNINNMRSGGAVGKKKVHSTINVFKAIRLYARYRLDAEASRIYSDPYSVQEVVLGFVKKERHSRVKTALADTIVAAMDFGREENELLDLIQKYKRCDDTKKDEEEKIALIVHALESSMLSHVESDDPKTKIYTMCMMIAQISEHIAGFRTMTNKNSWKNKRLLTPSKNCEQLFRGLWKCFVRESLKMYMTREQMPANFMRSLFTHFSTKYITDGFHNSFTGPRWGVKTVNVQEDNPVQILQHKTFMEMVMMLSRINVRIDRKTKSFEIRSVQFDQWGFVDPSDSTESSAIGLIKALAITCIITPGVHHNDVLLVLSGGLGVHIEGETVTELLYDNNYGNAERKTVMLINGFLIGWCNGIRTRDVLVAARREGIIDRMTSIVLDEHGYFIIHTDEGRLTRPLLIVDNGQLVIEKKREAGKNFWESSLDTLLRNQCIEYIDSAEQSTIRIAPIPEALDEWNDNVAALKEKTEAEELKIQEKAEEWNINVEDLQEKIASEYQRLRVRIDIVELQLKENVKVEDNEVIQFLQFKKDVAVSRANYSKYREDLIFELENEYTHAEIHPQALFAPSLTTMPFIHHTQAPRISFQSQMGRQALGTPSIGGQFRFDNDAKYLNRPTRPLVTQQLEDYQGLKKNPHGTTLTIAFLGRGGYEQEDAFTVREGVVDFGYMDISHYFVITTKVEEGEILMKPELSGRDDPQRYQFMTNQGLPMLNAPLNQGDYIIGKVYHNMKTKVVKNMSVVLKVGESGIVDTVNVVSSGRTTTVTVKIRRDRQHQISDKLSSRYTQKGTTSRIVGEDVLPFDEDSGEVADIYVNPHSMPKRMTLGYILEVLFGIVVSLTGKRFNSSAFERFDTDEAYNILKEYGFDSQGYRWMVDPITGRRFKAMVFMGPIYMQVLYHLGPEKLQVRSSGVKKLLTHQPPRSSAFGGRRVGEMERNAMISHGAAHFMIERLVTMSDAYTTVFCKRCGNIARLVSAAINRKECGVCGDKAEFVQMTIPYVYKLLVQLMFGTGVYLHLDFGSMDEDKDGALKEMLPGDLANLLGNDDKNAFIPEDGDEDNTDDHVEDGGVDIEVDEVDEDQQPDDEDIIDGLADELIGHDAGELLEGDDFYEMDEDGFDL